MIGKVRKTLHVLLCTQYPLIFMTTFLQCTESCKERMVLKQGEKHSTAERLYITLAQFHGALGLLGGLLSKLAGKKLNTI